MCWDALPIRLEQFVDQRVVMFSNNVPECNVNRADPIWLSFRRPRLILLQ